jgi:hypothetical protein
LYDKSKTTLIQYPAGKADNTFNIPNNVTSIGNNAFYNCTNLTSVTIPSSVTSIGGGAFDFCKILTSVTFATGSNIPEANFGYSAFPEQYEGSGGNNLRTAYNAASPKAGTYTRPDRYSKTWTKQ